MFDMPFARKSLKNIRLWFLIVLVSVVVWILVFYWVSLPSSRQKFEIWIGSDFELKDEIKDDIRSVCIENGMKECTINSYSPADGQYAAAFALGSRNIDIYILQKDEAAEEVEAEIFRELPSNLASDDSLEINGKKYGVPFKGDYYIFVNGKSNKSDELLQTIVKMLASYGEST